jgi:predicted HicB family RNase H-like nuclease
VKDKDLQHYLDLDYDIMVTRIEDDDQIAYKALSVDLDPLSFYGVGSTKAEAIKSFERTKNNLFRYYVSEGIPIPEPTRAVDSLPSGKFVVRTSPSLHAKLAREADRNGQSLNQYVNSLFQTQLTGVGLLQSLEDRLDAVVSRCENRIRSVYEFEWGSGTGLAFQQHGRQYREVG